MKNAGDPPQTGRPPPIDWIQIDRTFIAFTISARNDTDTTDYTERDVVGHRLRAG